MQSSIDRGYVRTDSYEYIGMAWTQLGDLEKGLAAVPAGPRGGARATSCS